MKKTKKYKIMTNEEIISVVQAHSEGKIIQWRSKRDKIWYDLLGEPEWNFTNCDYRIKPKSSIRPYTYTEICDAIKKHGGYVKAKFVRYIGLLTYVDEKGIWLCAISDDEIVTYDELLRAYEWLDDGSPCGTVVS